MRKEIIEFSTKELVSEWFDRFIEKYIFIVLFYVIAIPFIFIMLKGIIEA